MRSVKIFVAIAAVATALSAQAQGNSDQEVRRAGQRLVSPALVDKAWGAYFAGRLHSDELNEQLIEQLRIATPFRDMPGYSEEHAFTAVLFDALIEAGIPVPVNLLEPFEQSWTAPVLILASRVKDSDDLLLRLAGAKSRDDVWLAANNLLFARKSQQWYEAIWREIGITHRFYVVDATDRGFGSGIGVGGGGCSDGVLAMPKGFPPVTIYGLGNTGDPGSVVLAGGPRTSYYSRTIVPTGKQVGFGSCMSGVNRDAIRVGYLAHLRRESERDYERLFHPETNIQYTTAEELIRQMDQSLSAQENGLRKLILALEDDGLHAPETSLLIRPEVKDRRETPAGALPQAQPKAVQLH